MGWIETKNHLTLLSLYKCLSCWPPCMLLPASLHLLAFLLLLASLCCFCPAVPCDPIVVAVMLLLSSQSKQSAKLFLQSSQSGLPHRGFNTCCSLLLERPTTACVTAIACLPGVAGIAALAGVRLVPDILTFAGSPYYCRGPWCCWRSCSCCTIPIVGVGKNQHELISQAHGVIKDLSAKTGMLTQPYDSTYVPSLQRSYTKNMNKIFQEKELRGHSPNSTFMCL
jgi:hypothetical protein